MDEVECREEFGVNRNEECSQKLVMGSEMERTRFQDFGERKEISILTYIGREKKLRGGERKFGNEKESDTDEG